MADTGLKTVKISFQKDEGVYNEDIVFQFPYINEKCQINKKISIDTLKKHFDILLDFATKYKELNATDKKLFDNNEILNRSRKETVIEPCFEFLTKITDKELPYLLKLADVLHNQTLIGILCAKIANFISGSSLTVIREIWGIKNDLTEQEKEEIKIENEILSKIE
jgi:hypothetical protein